MAARSREDLRERDREIIRRLDVLAEARGFGLRPVEGAAPGEGGWLPCHAVGREDTDPSASFNVGDSPLRGRYRDFADGEGRAISFFDLAARAGRFPDWRAARDHYARITGLSENGPSRKGGRVYSTEAEARDAARRSAARELKAKPSELRLEQYVY
ncbi:MAG TPA: hypothetical protein VF170_19725, partial [Planctomycetaceae bacterium]